MESVFTHWKTSLGGAGAGLVALGHIAISLSNGGGIEAVDLMALSAMIIGFTAKDGDKK